MSIICLISVAGILGFVLGDYAGRPPKNGIASNMEKVLSERQSYFEAVGQYDLAALVKGLREGKNAQDMIDQLPPKIREEFEEFIKKDKE